MKRCLLLVVLMVLTLVPRASIAGGTMRIACVGDSLTAGDGDDDGGHGYPGRLQKRLPPGTKVVSYGVSGQTAKMVLEGYEQHPSQVKQALALQPDVVCVWVGSNDLWYLYEYNNPTAADERADAKRFAREVHAIVEPFRKKNVRVVLALLDDQSKRPVAVAGKAFTGISKAELARMSEQVKVYNGILRAEAKASGCSLVDFSRTTIFTDPATLTDDGNHPNAKGYDQIAALWWKALVQR